MSVTIQINSVAALERLLTGEGDQQVSICKAVLLEYERRHILPVIKARVKAIVEEAVAQHLGKSDWRGPQLKEPIAQEVKAIAGVEADQLISSQIRAAVKAVANAAKIKEMVEHHLASFVTVELTSQIRQQIKKKLEA